MRVQAKRRMAAALLLASAVTGSAGVLGVPAYGQSSAGVGNSGGASASTGGNSSVGNSSDNTAANTNTVEQTSEPLVGGLLGLVLNVGNTSTNTSSGSSTITTGAATASGNNSDTAVSQAGGGGVAPVFGHFAPAQSAGVSNTGDATASTGGNQGVGNDSTNVATNTQTVTGGLIAIGINTGDASNTSTGSSVITTGPATASGNEAVTTVDQVRVGQGFGAGGGAICDGFFRFGGQHVDVDNAGTAQAATGNNQSVGNQSTNTATNTQIVTGGLLNVPIDLGLTAAAANDSDGTSTIVTGPATATGNRSTTAVSQQDCAQPASFVATPPVFTPTVVKVIGTPVVTHQLATTGVDPFVLGVIAFSLLFGGLLFLVWERVESLPTGRTAV